MPRVAEDGAGDQVRRPGRGGGERDLGVRGQCVSGFLEPGRFDREPEHGVLVAYALTLASLLLTSGVLADRYGRKRLFLIGLVIFTLGSLLCGLAQDPLMLIVSRSGQGVGGAIMFATSLALLGHSFRGRDRGMACGSPAAAETGADSVNPARSA
jgi:Major Facilitator Superfamily